MSQEMPRNVRLVYDNGDPDSVIGPYNTLEQAEDMASVVLTYPHVTEVRIEFV